MARQPSSFSRGHDDSDPRQAAVTEMREAVLEQLFRLPGDGDSHSPETSPRRASDTTFWGQAWRANLESYADYADRLPQGKTYLAQGDVVDLRVEKGVIRASVTRPRAEPYSVAVRIRPITPARWKYLVRQCEGKIDSMNDLLQGRLSDAVLRTLTDRASGMLPYPAEIDFDSACPEWASVGKHIVAVLYSFGDRLDETPELLFELRGVQHSALITSGSAAQVIPSQAEHDNAKADSVALSPPVAIETETVFPLEPSPPPAAAAAAPTPVIAPVPPTAPESPSPVVPDLPPKQKPSPATRPAPAKRPVASPRRGKRSASASSSQGRAAQTKSAAEPKRPAARGRGGLPIVRRDDLLARNVPAEIIDFWIEQGLLPTRGADDVFLLSAELASRVEKFEQMGRRKGRR